MNEVRGDEGKIALTELFSKPLVTGSEVENRISLEAAMFGQRQVFAAYDAGESVMGARGLISNQNSTLFAYIARASSNGPAIVKFGSITNSNKDRHLPVVQAYLAVLNQETGSLEYFIDGEAVTKLRTPAASMVAAQLLANKPNRIVVVGGGAQGQAHLNAASKVFNPSELALVTRGEFNQPNIISVEHTLERDIHLACHNADLIFLCTNSFEPVLTHSPMPGATVISIGGFAPVRSEVSVALLTSGASIYADDAQTAYKQCGSIVDALKTNANLEVTSLGRVINHPEAGRKNELQIIYYFSVGLGFQDAAIVEQLVGN